MLCESQVRLCNFLYLISTIYFVLKFYCIIAVVDLNQYLTQFCQKLFLTMYTNFMFHYCVKLIIIVRTSIDVLGRLPTVRTSICVLGLLFISQTCYMAVSRSIRVLSFLSDSYDVSLRVRDLIQRLQGLFVCQDVYQRVRTFLRQFRAS